MIDTQRKDLANDAAFQAFLARIVTFGTVHTPSGDAEIYRELKQATLGSPSGVGAFLGYSVKFGGNTVTQHALTLSLSTFDGLVAYSGEPATLQQEIDALAARVTALENA